MQLLVYRSLSHYLLLPWPAVSEADQQWEARAAQHAGFVAKLTHDFLQLRAANLSQDAQLQQQGQFTAANLSQDEQLQQRGQFTAVNLSRTHSYSSEVSSPPST